MNHCYMQTIQPLVNAVLKLILSQHFLNFPILLNVLSERSWNMFSLSVSILPRRAVIENVRKVASLSTDKTENYFKFHTNNFFSDLGAKILASYVSLCRLLLLDRKRRLLNWIGRAKTFEKKNIPQNKSKPWNLWGTWKSSWTGHNKWDWRKNHSVTIDNLKLK